MHRFQSSSTIHRIRITALLVCLKWLLAPVAIGTLAYSLYIHNRDLTFLAIGVGGVAVLALVLQWLLASRTRCPLCMTPVLANKACSKHRNAKRFIGSYRLMVSLSALFRGWFRCPYCNEPSVLKVRERR